MKASELREKFIKFFEERGHAHIPSSSLVPQDDPTTLFVSAGMQPLIPYLLGQPHPHGRRLVNYQKCLRTDDIEEVGDTFHHTFFEMLGNWSLGDYFKNESIPWSLEFLTKELGLEKDKISVSVFAGDEEAPRDEESAEIWKKLGIPKERIYYYGKKDNWWAAGPTGPAGPDTEIFYDVTGKPHGPDCEPNDNCGRYFEIWNNVFMVYNRKEDGTLEELPNKNVDTGMGLERTVAVLQGKDDNYETELFQPIIQTIEELSGRSYSEDKEAFRIIADHMRAVVFALADGVEFSNVDRGYIPRRLLRRSIVRLQALQGRKGELLKDYLREYLLDSTVQAIIENYKNPYSELKENKKLVSSGVKEEWVKFQKGMQAGYPELMKVLEAKGKVVSGKDAFRLFESFGIHLEVTEEAAQRYKKTVDREGFEREFKKHQRQSRQAGKGRFAGGLADTSPETIKLHTTTHLLHAALRKVLGEHVEQKGSNITSERLRFDFSHPKKLSEDEIKKVEDLVNEQIKKALPVSWEEKNMDEALEEGALAFFGEKYADAVKVYTIGPSTGPSTLSSGPKGSGWFSKEVCGGPHVDNTAEIGHVTITKEESAGSGVRRIYAKLG